MNINIKNEKGLTKVILEGKLDTNTSPLLETKISGLDNVEKVELDLKKLDYISSAGLRVILAIQKEVSKKGGMEIINVNDNVMDVFDVTGFSEILNIKKE